MHKLLRTCRHSNELNTVQQTNLSDFLQSREGIGRSEASADVPWVKVDHRIARDYRLSDRARSYALKILSCTDRWCFDHLNSWLQGETGMSKATVGRAIKELVRCGYLHPTQEYCRTKRQYVYSFKFTEVPLLDPGRDPFEREKVLHRIRYCDDINARGPQSKMKRFGGVAGDFDPLKTARPSRRICAEAVRHGRRTYTGGRNVPSEHSNTTPLSPKGDLDLHDATRVMGPDNPLAQRDTSARGAKRRKGRKSPAKPHNARRKSAQLSRRQINLSGFRSLADTREFMANLTTRLQPALDELSSLPPARTAEWLETLRNNPLVAVAQEAMGLEEWHADAIKRFLRLIGRNLPIADLLLVWIADYSDFWQGSVPFDIRRRLRERDKPTSPDICDNEIWPEMRQLSHYWDDALDQCRTKLARSAREAVESLIANTDFDDPESIIENPLAWTAILASPLSIEDIVCPETLDLARRTLKRVSREELEAWVANASEGMACRWWGGLCGDGNDWDHVLEAIIGRGISAALGETLPEAMWKLSDVSRVGYVTDEFGWKSTAKVPLDPQYPNVENGLVQAYKLAIDHLENVRRADFKLQNIEDAARKLEEIRSHFAFLFPGQEPMTPEPVDLPKAGGLTGENSTSTLQEALHSWEAIVRKRQEASDLERAERDLYREYCNQMAEDDKAWPMNEEDIDHESHDVCGNNSFANSDEP